MPQSDPKKLTDEELNELAESLVINLLSSAAAPFRQGFSGVRKNPTLIKLAAESLGFGRRAKDPQWVIKFGHALVRKNRGGLLVLIKDAFIADPPSYEEALKLRRLGSRAIWRKGLLGAAEMFKGERGIRAKIELGEYEAIADLGDWLAPACEKILEGLKARPDRSLVSVVEECRKEHPEEGTFLLRHLERLKSALEDRGLLNRAKKFETRAGSFFTPPRSSSVCLDFPGTRFGTFTPPGSVLTMFRCASPRRSCDTKTRLSPWASTPM